MEPGSERERSGLGGLFQSLVSDMKGSSPLWDDLLSKASKLQSQLRATVGAVSSFLDAFQRVAELASSSRGGTRDIGVALSRTCLSHRSIETKLRHFSVMLVECLVEPLQEQMEEWKRSLHSLDKDHSKEYKKVRQELKKRSSDSLKLQKKTKKGLQLDREQVLDRVQVLEELEKNAVRRALLEERGRFCCLVSMLRPLMEEEMSFLGEVSHLQTLSEDLRILTMDPHKLPPSSEQVLLDLKSSESSWSFQTPPTSPTSSVSSSVNSGSSGDSSESPHFRFRSGSGPAQPGSARLSSVSSHDSGFNSQDFSGRSPVSTATCLLQAAGGAVQRNRERSSHQNDDLTPGEEPKAGRHHATSTQDRDELFQALTRGLSLDFQASHRDSAYSSQSHTPSCSEDHTGSEGDNFSVGAESEADPQTSDLDRPHSAVTRVADSSHCHASRRAPPLTLGVATIRRAPSSKASLRRGSLGLSLGPVPVRPVIPVKTPTVPPHSPLPSPPSPQLRPRRSQTLPQLSEVRGGGDYLRMIRRGVKLKRNHQVNDRSAPLLP